MQNHSDLRTEKQNTSVLAETIVALQQGITELEKKLQATSDKDTSTYRSLKKDLTQLYIQLGDAAKSDNKCLDACAAYYHAFELTGSLIVMRRLGAHCKSIPSSSVTNKINIPTADSYAQASKYFRHGLQALTGIGLKAPNESHAFAYFEAASKQHIPSCILLALLYRDGRGVGQDDEQAFKYCHEAAELDYATAQNNLGYMYQKGLGVAQDHKQAFGWYLKAAEQGYAAAQNNLGWMYKKGLGVAQDHKQAVAWFLKAAEQGNATAQNKLGWMYENGLGVAQNHKQAFAWYLKAAEQGYAAAQCNLGWMYQKALGVAQNHKQAVAWYLKAAEQGNATAQYKLGQMYENGLGVALNHKQAMAWYLRAAEQGNATAQCKLGLIYIKGQGVAHDYEKAVAWLLKAAEQGNATAQYNLGCMYSKGLGVAQNHKQAFAWLLKAAEQGYAVAQCNLGWMYENGLGVAQNHKQAVAWYLKAAEQGYAVAQNNLGWMYSKGLGIAHDYEKAVAWFHKAAEQGCVKAQCILGWMYSKGLGVAQNHKQAFAWYLKAANQGYAAAQNKLGWMYSKGLGVAQDNEQAQLWWERYINNIGFAQLEDREKKFITDFFNSVLVKSQQLPKSYLNCVLRANRLGLNIKNLYAHQVFAVYQIMKHLDYTKLIESLREFDGSIKDKFTPENYINEVRLLYSKSTGEYVVNFFGFTTISKSDRRYQIAEKILLHLKAEIEKKKNIDSEMLNIDNMEPYKLVKVFGDILAYMAPDEPYNKRKQSVTNLVRVANKKNTYLSELPAELLTYTAYFVVANTVSSKKRTTLVNDCFTRLKP